MATPNLIVAPIKVLALDDKKTALTTIKNLLESYEYEVKSTTDFDEAINLAKKFNFDALILDQKMPGKTGLEVLKEIREFNTTQAAIIISAAEPSEELKDEMSQVGAIFVNKSNLNVVIEKLSMLLEQEHHPIKIFISYTKPDFDKVTWIYRRLKDNGFLPWIDIINIPPGYPWDKEIEKAINDCDYFLSCLSDISVKRLSYFQAETKMAVARYDIIGEPFILPLLFDNCAMPKEFADRNIHYINYDPFHDDWWTLLLMTLRSKRRN